MSRTNTIQDRIGNLLKSFGARSHADRRQLVAGLSAQNASIWPRLDEYGDQADEYSRSAWVYVAVTRIAEACALVPIGAYQLQGEKQIAIQNHPIERLLRSPNSVQSQFELLEATFGFLELAGNAYWFLAGNDQPEEIWVLRPDRVRIVPSPTDYVGGYVYTLDGQDIPLDRSEVIHFRRFHPRSDYYGLSPLQAAALAATSDRAMAQFNRNFMSDERAIPAGVVTIKQLVSDADYERIKREFLTQHSGANRRTMFIRGSDEVQWQALGLSQREMDFIQSRRMNRDEIFSIFGLPVSMIEPSATQAVAEVGRRIFLEDTIWPKLIRFTQKLTQQLAPFWSDSLILEPEEIRDTSPDIAEIGAAAGYLTVNEVRQRFWNLPGLPDGNLTQPLAPPSPIKSELDQWERWALKRIGRLVERQFTTRIIPPELAATIGTELIAADGDADRIKHVFGGFRDEL